MINYFTSKDFEGSFGLSWKDFEREIKRLLAETKPVVQWSLKAEKPAWKIGYWWEYTWVRPGRGGTYEDEVVREENIEGAPCYVVERGRSEYFYTKDSIEYIARLRRGNVMRKNRPPRQDFSWPLEVGKEWRNEYLLERPMKDTSVPINITSLVAKNEVVKVPAGTFQTPKVEYYNSKSGKLGGEFWYSPRVKWIVKSRIYLLSGVREAELIGYKTD